LSAALNDHASSYALADSGRTRSQQALTIPLSGERSRRAMREADAGQNEWAQPGVRDER
jgi:hypothetical protein